MNELIVSRNEEGLRIGILDDKRIVELHHEKTDALFSVGDIVLGRIKKLVPGLNAAFVEIGHSKDAFLHYLDLGPQVRSMLKYLKQSLSDPNSPRNLEHFERLPDTDKNGKIAQIFKNGQPVLVQVVKEAISTKGPRLSCEISLPGQYIILVPFNEDVSVSRKIGTPEEKKRLRSLLEGLRPPNFGIIIRTAAEGRDLVQLKEDLDDLMRKWADMTAALPTAKAPATVLSEQARTTSILRDMLSTGFDSITVDDKETFEEIATYLKSKMPEGLKNLKMYKGKVTLFEHAGIDRQIKASFGKTVTMHNGAYLVIEHTEALHVIDVNSGSKHLSGSTLEENALKTNTLAATEIARQLRLRDMGGIIVIDFIDLKRNENKKKLFDHLREEMKTDRAKHTILPMSRFGLVQITRQRVRPEISIVTSEVCPACNGTGKIQPTVLITDEIATNVDFLVKQNKEKALTVVVNPFVEAFLTKGLWNWPRRWFFKYQRRIRVKGDNQLPFSAVKYFNAKGEEIKL